MPVHEPSPALFDTTTGGCKPFRVVWVGVDYNAKSDVVPLANVFNEAIAHLFRFTCNIGLRRRVCLRPSIILHSAKRIRLGREHLPCHTTAVLSHVPKTIDEKLLNEREPRSRWRFVDAEYAYPSLDIFVALLRTCSMLGSGRKGGLATSTDEDAT